ncbi:MAG TPA: transcriptional repressor [Spirochaetota bacterium]
MDTPLDRLSAHVKAQGLKSSNQRAIILSAMNSDGKHHTVDEIYSSLQKDHPDIGIATVYRTIRLLCDAGIARELIINHQVSRYEIVSDDEHHDHIVCTSCGRFVEISSDLIEKEQVRIAGQNDFTLTDHSLILYGLCKECGTTSKTGATS